MKFWTQDVMKRINNREDKDFLISMMGDRISSLGPVDKVLSRTEKKVYQNP